MLHFIRLEDGRGKWMYRAWQLNVYAYVTVFINTIMNGYYYLYVSDVSCCARAFHCKHYLGNTTTILNLNWVHCEKPLLAIVYDGACVRCHTVQHSL